MLLEEFEALAVFYRGVIVDEGIWDE